MITVICVYKPEPGFWGMEEYVYRLQEAVEKYLPAAHNFRCITPVNLPGVDCIVPQRDWPGYWSKMEIWEHAKTDLNLYLDLDTMPNGDLRPIFSRLICCPAGTLVGAEDRMAPGCLNSSVMAWQGGMQYLAHLFEAQWRHDAKRLRTKYAQRLERYGDQGFIQDNLMCEPVFLKNLVASYKLDTTEARKEAAVVFFHGEPRPHQVGWQPW